MCEICEEDDRGDWQNVSRAWVLKYRECQRGPTTAAEGGEVTRSIVNGRKTSVE